MNNFLFFTFRNLVLIHLLQAAAANENQSPLLKPLFCNLRPLERDIICRFLGLYCPKQGLEEIALLIDRTETGTARLLSRAILKMWKSGQVPDFLTDDVEWDKAENYVLFAYNRWCSNPENKPYADARQYREARDLAANPDCRMEDEHGNPAPLRMRVLSERLSSLTNNLCWNPIVYNEHGKLGLYDHATGKKLTSAKYDGFEQMHIMKKFTIQDALEWPNIDVNVVSARKGVYWGMVRADGKDTEVCPFVYDEPPVYLGYNSYYVVCKEDKFGVIEIEPGYAIEIRPCTSGIYGALNNL